MLGTVDATCMADARPVPREVSAMAAGVAGSIPRKQEPTDGGSAS